MMHDVEAQHIVRRSLEAAAETGVTTRGCNLGFRIFPGPVLTDSDLTAYCSSWMNVVNPSSEVGWRPRVDPTDRTVISLVSRDLVSCQGRSETVHALSVMAAGFACRISPHVAMALPAAAPFWDWVERHRIRTKQFTSRPLSAFGSPSGEQKDKLVSYSSPAVLHYEGGVCMDEQWLMEVSKAKQAMQQSDMRYISPCSLEEANRLLTESYKIVMSNYDGHAYLRSDMQHGSSITNGQMLRYCQRVWHDSELYQLGTRWRPARLAKVPWSRSRKEIRGGVFLPDQYSRTAIAVDGSAALCQGLAPVIAAMRIRLDPEIAKKCRVFEEIFHDFVDYIGTSFLEARVISDFNFQFDDPSIQHDEAFTHEEKIMQQVMSVLQAEYSRTQGQYHGANALPGVVWSQEDFVNHLMTWWPDAEIQASGKFRYVPGGLEKGGLEMHENGDSFSCQGRSAWQGALMAMTASLVCGIPAPIAALLPASNVFWNQISNEFGRESALEHRRRLGEIRDVHFGLTWKRSIAKRDTTNSCWSSVDNRPEKNEARRDDWNIKRETERFEKSSRSNTEKYRVQEEGSGSTPVSLGEIDVTLKNLEEYAKATRGLWMEARVIHDKTETTQISSYLTALGKATVGGESPMWEISISGASCLFVCVGLGLDFFLFSKNLIGAKSFSPALMELMTAVACDVPPSQVVSDERFSRLIDLMVEVCLGQMPNVAAVFSQAALRRVKENRIRFDPPKPMSD